MKIRSRQPRQRRHGTHRASTAACSRGARSLCNVPAVCGRTTGAGARRAERPETTPRNGRGGEARRSRAHLRLPWGAASYVLPAAGWVDEAHVHDKIRDKIRNKTRRPNRRHTTPTTNTQRTRHNTRSATPNTLSRKLTAPHTRSDLPCPRSHAAPAHLHEHTSKSSRKFARF